ncbi:DUF3533 domain-containing protein [Streptomyces mirabilis]|uniref:DUF3533 domain-containing protein n=1 Tax=Streptomyces mirabilis TaxID=68239 RepID=UPI0033B3A627
MNGIHPFRVLRARPLWIASGVITGVLALLFAVLYVGSNIDPVGHMKNLPVGLVNADKGADLGGKQVNLGAQITESIKKSDAGGGKVDWKVMDEKHLKVELGKGKLYGALVVPSDFTSSVTALTGTAATTNPIRPQLTVLTNQSAGSLGSTLARQVTTAAAEASSLHVGKGLTAQTEAKHAKLSAAARVLLADPAAITMKDGHPLDSHSGLGLTAFYYALALVVCGMLSANVISGQVDHALGYTHNDMGPLRRHRPLIRATRVQTLAVSSTLMAALSLLMGTLVMVGAVGLMGMDASHLPLLWLYSVAAIAVVGIGALTLLAVFGTPGMLLVTLVFIAMAVPTANATVPIQALPGFYRFLAEFEPLRQIGGGIRSILYFDAQGDAGLTRGWTMMAAGLAAAALFGFGVLGWYDRKGLHRIPAETEHKHAKNAAPAGPGFHGRVRDSEGKPVARATLALVSPSGRQLGRTVSHGDGSYALDAPADSSYVLITAADGHQPQAGTVTAGAEPLTYDIALAPTAGRAGLKVQGTVRARSDRRPLADARLTLVDTAGNVVRTTTTGADGGYAFTDLAAGEYSLIASGYAPVASTLVVASGATEDFDIELLHPAAE